MTEREKLIDLLQGSYCKSRKACPSEGCRACIAEYLIENGVTFKKNGRWISSHDEFCECSLCRYPVFAAWNKTNYCPNCGAKMDGDNNE